MFWANLLFLNLCLALIPPKDLKPDVFILTDISNEPDDAESLVRLLLYSNELEIHGIVATTSYWLNYTTHEEDIYPIVDAYEDVWPNLVKHLESYPSADHLRSLVTSGHPDYGLEAFKRKEISDGARSLILAVDKTDLGGQLNVLVWGGAGVLAEALNEVRKTRLEAELALFVSKILVYSISDQDNAGTWLRINFPKLRYIASVHGFNQYGLAAWVGISGEKYNPFDFGGPDSDLVSKDWLRQNIQAVGPLGKVYLDPMFSMEGDTPSLLFVVPNGLNFPSRPEIGGWGGRYIPVDISGYLNHYSDTTDYVEGQDGQTHVSNKASIWRWREAYQNDFKVRMQWTVSEFENAFHQPIVKVNGSDSFRPMEIDTEVESTVILDASESFDLNGNHLQFKWWHYREVSVTQSNIVEVPEIAFEKLNDSGSIVHFQAPDFKTSCHNVFGRPLESCKEFHVILEVSNEGTRAYKRVVLKMYKGEREFADFKLEQNFGVHHDEL